jgi:hypothetical protein
MEQKQFNERVNDKLEALLARVQGIRLARDIGRPTKFNAAGERHARAIAKKDQQ